MNRVCFIVVLILALSGSLFAEPSSQVAWTPDAIAFVKKGNAAIGKNLATQCNSCHGINGISTAPDYPSLAGQLANYTYKQLKDFQSGSRNDRIMSALAANLSNEDIANLAAWYSSLPPLAWEESGDITRAAETIVYSGDNKRVLTPCSVCHGTDGRGEVMDVPALTGQQFNYLKKALTDYKTGKRHNDIYSRMRLIVERLSKEEIEGLAEYYSGDLR